MNAFKVRPKKQASPQSPPELDLKAAMRPVRRKIRRSIDMSTETSTALDRLEKLLALDNHSQVIRKAIQVLEVLVEFQEREITIFVAKPGAPRHGIRKMADLQEVRIM